MSVGNIGRQDLLSPNAACLIFLRDFRKNTMIYIYCYNLAKRNDNLLNVNGMINKNVRRFQIYMFQI